MGRATTAAISRPFRFVALSAHAQAQYDALAADRGRRVVLKAVDKAIEVLRSYGMGYKSFNPKTITAYWGPRASPELWRRALFPKEPVVWQLYAQNNTPGAWRIFGSVGPADGVFTVWELTPHP